MGLVTLMVILHVLLSLYVLTANSAVICLAWNRWKRDKPNLNGGPSAKSVQKVFLVNAANFAVADLLLGLLMNIFIAVQFATGTEDIAGRSGTIACKLIGSLSEFVPEIPGFLIICSGVVSILMLSRRSSTKTLNALGAQAVYVIGWILPFLLLGIPALIFYDTYEILIEHRDSTEAEWVCFWQYQSEILRFIMDFWRFGVILLVIALNLITVCIRYCVCLSVSERSNRLEGYRFAYSAVFLIGTIVYEIVEMTPIGVDYTYIMSTRESVMKSAGIFIPLIILVFILKNLRLILNPTVPLVYFVRDSKASRSYRPAEL